MRACDRSTVLAGVLIAVLAGSQGVASANEPQASPTLNIRTAAGCVVFAELKPSRNAARRWVLVNGQKVTADISDPDAGGNILALLQEPLLKGQRVTLQYGEVKADALVEADKSVLGCVGNKPADFADDDRDAVDTPIYVGAGYEQFSPGFSNVSASTQASRAIAGVNAQYRFFRVHPGRWPLQLWVYGNFLAGLRSYCSTDVPQATPNEDPASTVICKPFGTSNIDTATFVIRNATSFETSLGLRFEFLELNVGSKFAGNMFVTVRDARFALDRATANKLSDPIYAGLGLVVTKGPLRGTSLMGGLGPNSLYGTEPGTPSWHRIKGEFNLVFGPSKSFKDYLTFWDRTKEAMRFYFATRSDFDLGGAPDSVRIGMGVSFAPSSFFSAGSPK